MAYIGASVALFPLLWGAEATAQSGWDKVVAEAEKEGQVNIGGPPGDTYRRALVEEFVKKYPKIKVEWDGASGRDKMARLVRERQSGIFNWDLYIGGSGSPLRVLKPIGAFDPLRPEVILPEASDDNKWYGGFDFGFVDTEKKLIFGFDATGAEVLHVNWESIRPGDFKSIKDLADPKWAGKIVWEDPRQEGSGLNTALLFMLSYGEDFLKKLLSDRNIVFSLDRRQLTEWVVRGRYPIGVSVPTDLLETYQEKGVGKNVKPLVDPTLSGSFTQGFGSVAVFNRRPHPNTTKVYLNWLLSKDGQTSWATHIGGRNSRRLDVPAGVPDLVLKPDRKYINTQAEDYIPKRVHVMALGKELIRQ
jgi:iron(III) transport system substrate-binding protein